MRTGGRSTRASFTVTGLDKFPDSHFYDSQFNRSRREPLEASKTVQLKLACYFQSLAKIIATSRVVESFNLKLNPHFLVPNFVFQVKEMESFHWNFQFGNHAEFQRIYFRSVSNCYKLVRNVQIPNDKHSKCEIHCGNFSFGKQRLSMHPRPR